MHDRLVQKAIDHIGIVPVGEHLAARKVAGDVVLVALDGAQERSTEAACPCPLGTGEPHASIVPPCDAACDIMLGPCRPAAELVATGRAPVGKWCSFPFPRAILDRCRPLQNVCVCRRDDVEAAVEDGVGAFG